MKKSHTKETEVNLLKPVSKDILPEEQTDCFGKEFEPRSSECSVCADDAICQILWSETVKSKVKNFEAEHGPTLDMTDFQGVDMARIEKLAKKYQEEGEPMTFEELQKIIQEQARTKDVEAIIQFIKRELPLTKIYLKEGVCKVR